MGKGFGGIVALLLAVIVAPAGGLAQEDREGCEDHPIISRFEGSVIDRCVPSEFNEYLLPLGPWEDGELADSRRLEGELTRLWYRLPEGASTLEVHRSFERALSRAGFEVLFSCARDECGADFLETIYEEGVNNMVEAYGIGFGNTGTALRYSFDDMYAGDERYLSARLERPEGDVFVSLLTVHPSGVPNQHHWEGHNFATLDVMEVEAMEEGQVEVTAEGLAEEIDRTGRVAVQAIQFNTGSAELTPGSAPVIREIAKLLEANPELSVYVVGHTDNTGGFEANMTLSRQRAESVRDVLVAEHGVDGGRLQPVGVGPAAPVATNETEEGRAENRRVVLVRR